MTSDVAATSSIDTEITTDGTITINPTTAVTRKADTTRTLIAVSDYSDKNS